MFNRIKKFRFSDWACNTSGQVAIIFGLSIIPIISIVGFTIDFQQATTQKGKVQAVIDSAVLAGARAMQAGKNQQEIKEVMHEYLIAQRKHNATSNTLWCSGMKVTFAQGSQDIAVSVDCEQETSLMQIVGKKTIDFNVSSMSTWGIGKVDVAFMLDVSGSMNSNSRLNNLKASAIEAIDVLLPADAPPEIIEDTRIAMVSYNGMVNAGAFFESVTGQPATRTYTHTIQSSGGDPKPGRTDRNLIVQLINTNTNEVIAELGDNAVIQVPENQLSNLTITVDARPSGSHSSSDILSYRLRLSDGMNHTQNENYPPYAMFGDTLWNNSRGDLEGRTFEHNEPYRLRIDGYRRQNRQGGLVERIDFDFELVGDGVPETVTHTLTSTCVWERDGSDAFTDGKPKAGAYLAHQEAWFVEDKNRSDGGYWETGSKAKPGDNQYQGTECSQFAPVELTNDRDKLKAYVNSLRAGGTTAGHLGTAWSWYMIAPTFKDVFDGDAEPLPYDEPDAVKAVILMTDGENNRQLFDSQGDSDAQARELCDAMKASNIVVYTVALQAPNSGKAILEYCSSGPEFYFNASNGDELSQAYVAIATSLSDLRIKF
jgi:Flp pilus assembly protein TadG